MAAENQAAGGVAVEPMGEGRFARQAEAQSVEIVLETCAALRAAVDGNPGRLVEDEHQSVAIKQPRSCFFRGHG